MLLNDKVTRYFLLGGGGGQNKIGRNLYFRGPINSMSTFLANFVVEVIFCCHPSFKNFEMGWFLRIRKKWTYFLEVTLPFDFPFFSTSPIPGQFHVSFQYSREGKEFSNSRDSSQVVHCSSICSCAVVVNFSRNFMVGAKNNMKSVKWRWQYSLPGLILIPLKREEFL